MVSALAWLLPILVLVPPAPVVPAAPAFEASTVAGTAVGRVKSLSSGFAVAWDDPATPPGDLVALRRVGRAIPARPREPMLVLANGDVVAGATLGGDANRVTFRPRVLGPRAEPWAVPLTAVAAAWLDAPDADTPAEPARYSWAGDGKRDALLLRTRDVLRGGIDGLTPEGVRFKSADRPAEVVPLGRVAAVAFDPTLARVRKVKTVHARVVLADGSRLTLTQVSADAAALRGVSPAGPRVEVGWAEVVALDVVNGPATSLADLTPKAAEVTPFTGLSWPWRTDRSVRGEPLRLRGESGVSTFDRGLGLHSRTRLTYDLAGKYRRFEARVGLDAATGRRGAADVTILLDGKPAPLESLRRLSAATGTVAVSLDATGATELTLLVDYGPGGDTQDDVNFADARLIESPAIPARGANP